MICNKVVQMGNSTGRCSNDVAMVVNKNKHKRVAIIVAIRAAIHFATHFATKKMNDALRIRWGLLEIWSTWALTNLNKIPTVCVVAQQCFSATRLLNEILAYFGLWQKHFATKPLGIRWHFVGKSSQMVQQKKSSKPRRHPNEKKSHQDPSYIPPQNHYNYIVIVNGQLTKWIVKFHPKLYIYITDPCFSVNFCYILHDSSWVWHLQTLCYHFRSSLPHPPRLHPPLQHRDVGWAQGLCIEETFPGHLGWRINAV